VEDGPSLSAREQLGWTAIKVPASRAPAEPEAERTSSGPRFDWFVAAIEANPPPRAQLLEELPWSQFQPAPRAKAAPTVPPPIKARSRNGSAMLWLGSSSALFCMALAASLFQWPDRGAADRGIGVRSDPIQHRTAFSHARETADDGNVNQLERRSSSEGLVPLVATTAGRYMDTRPAPEQVAEEALVAEPVARDSDRRVSGIPPRPRLKPPINHMTTAAPHSAAEN
jgi:hypothetical protein